MEVTKKIRISVVIPVYNAESYLDRCFDSISSQTVDELEIIAVNDHSSDGSLEKLYQIGKRESRLRIIDKSCNQGTMLARRDGICAAHGEYLAFVDADDYLPPQSFKILLDKAILSGSDLVMGDFWDVDLNGIKNYVRQVNPGTTAVSFVSSLLIEYNIPSLCGKLFKKSIYDSHSFQELEGITFSEDRKWLLQYLSYATSIEHVNEPCYCYVHNSDSVTWNKMTNENIRQFEDTNQWCDRFILTNWPSLYNEVKLGQTMDAMCLIVRMIKKGGQNFHDLLYASPLYASFLSLSRLVAKFGLSKGIHKYLWCHCTSYRFLWDWLRNILYSL